MSETFRKWRISWKAGKKKGYDKMKVINATTIGILISAHMEGDEVKFLWEKKFIEVKGND